MPNFIIRKGIIPEAGMVLMCDFHGYVKPEIVKNRHVIVLSSKLFNSWGTVVVVPVSSGAPKKASKVHFMIPANKYPCFRADEDQWVKGNLLSHVRFARLDRVKANGQWCTPKIDEKDLGQVCAAAAAAIL